jgi:hypothetical protein
MRGGLDGKGVAGVGDAGLDGSKIRSIAIAPLSRTGDAGETIVLGATD